MSYTNDYLLEGIKALTEPDFRKMNQHDLRNDRLLHAVLCAYAKHHLGNEDIGWERLAEILQSVICNEIGSDAFCDWLDRIKPDDGCPPDEDDDVGTDPLSGTPD